MSQLLNSGALSPASVESAVRRLLLARFVWSGSQHFDGFSADQMLYLHSNNYLLSDAGHSTRNSSDDSVKFTEVCNAKCLDFKVWSSIF